MESPLDFDDYLYLKFKTVWLTVNKNLNIYQPWNQIGKSLNIKY